MDKGLIEKKLKNSILQSIKNPEEVKRDIALCREIDAKFKECVGKSVELIELWNETKINKGRRFYGTSKKRLESEDVQAKSNFAIKMGEMKRNFEEVPYFVQAVDCDTREFYDFAIEYFQKIRPGKKPFEIIKRKENGEISKNPNIIFITYGSCWPRKSIDYKRENSLIGQILICDSYLLAVGNFVRSNGEKVYCEHNDGEIFILKDREILDLYIEFNKRFPGAKLERSNKEKKISKDNRVWRNKRLMKVICDLERGATLQDYDCELKPWQKDLVKVLGDGYVHYFEKMNEQENQYRRRKRISLKKDVIEEDCLDSKISKLVSFKEDGNNYTNRFFFDSINELVKKFGASEIENKSNYYFDYVFSFLRKTSKPKESYFGEFESTIKRVVSFYGKNHVSGLTFEEMALPAFLLEWGRALPEYGEKTEFVFEFLKFLHENFKLTKNYKIHTSTLRRKVYPFSGSVCERAIALFKDYLFNKALLHFFTLYKRPNKHLLNPISDNKQIYAQVVLEEFLSLVKFLIDFGKFVRGPPLY